MHIVIAPIHQTFFTGRIWEGLDIIKIKTILETRYSYQVTIIDFASVASDYDLLPQNACFFYTVSYDENYNRYICDVMVDLMQARKDILFMPDLNQLFSFENKGYQELYKRRLGIEHIKGKYFGDDDDLTNSDFDGAYPFVLKKINGSVSSGVKLIKNKAGLQAHFRKEKKNTLIETLRLWRRRYRRWKGRSKTKGKEDETNYAKFFTKRSSFVIQEYIPNLTYDYKILVFGERYYTMKRNVRDNDFRASGSGKFEWIAPPSKVLDYAQELMKKMNIPFCSFDIIETETHCALVEFQGIGFGPIALLKSTFYHIKSGKDWEKVDQQANLEEEYANAIHDFLIKQKDENN